MRKLTATEIRSISGATMQGVAEVLAGDLIIEASAHLDRTPAVRDTLYQRGKSLRDQGAADGGDPQSGGGAPGPSGPGPKHDVWECVKFHSCEQ